MDVILAARELGKAIQADERFIRTKVAEQANEEDQALQQSIREFNGKRAELNSEVQKSDKDHDRIQVLDGELKAMYKEIFQNENMQSYSAAREELNYILNFVNQIITGSANGQDPEAIQYQESCGGDCGGCSGCS